MKNLAEFKRRLQVGQLVHTFNHNTGDMGIRPVSIVQSNSFAFKTTKPDGKIVDSWCEYPKAKDFEIVDENTASIYWGEGPRREKILTYTFK